MGRDVLADCPGPSFGQGNQPVNASKFSGLELAVDQPARMTIVHPHTRQPLRDAEGYEAYIELHSMDSGAARKHRRAVTQRRLALRGGGTATPEEIEAEGDELLAALTAGWKLVGLDGSPIDVPFSEQNARELYHEPSLAWLREQVDQFVVVRANFSKASSSS